jgi:hypothetical protein
MKKEHTLRWPLTKDSGEKINVVVVDTINIEVYQALIKKHEKDDDSITFSAVDESTDLDESMLNKLRLPDYNTLRNIVHNFLNKGADQFIDDIDPSNPKLLVPIKGEDGKEIVDYILEVPDVQTSKLMHKYKTPFEKSLFLSANCTGMTPYEVQQLSLPDWNYLQERLIDFLDEQADYFQ